MFISDVQEITHFDIQKRLYISRMIKKDIVTSYILQLNKYFILLFNKSSN
jgi:hypothetical protein